MKKIVLVLGIIGFLVGMPVHEVETVSAQEVESSSEVNNSVPNNQGIYVNVYETFWFPPSSIIYDKNGLYGTLYFNDRVSNDFFYNAYKYSGWVYPKGGGPSVGYSVIPESE